MLSCGFIGHSQQNLLLLISFTELSNVIHIISARLATRKEHEDYEQQVKFCIKKAQAFLPEPFLDSTK
ncbi:hypothetical protein F8R90_16500 [Nostoc sp. NZL]|nr:hypothetical protein [Nostoc sp. NZL]